MASPNLNASGYPAHLIQEIAQVKHANGQVEYAGYAAPGSSLKAQAWLIKKYEYDADGFMTRQKMANGGAGNLVFNSGASEYASYDYAAT